MTKNETPYVSDKTLKGVATHEETIRNSRFIAIATRVDSVDQAMRFIDTAGRRDASHNCWAYRIGRSYRFNDDGEPGGSAGRPIFSAIERHELDHVIVLVIRYYGGIKLGAGGLARAYGGTASSCLQKADIHIVQKQVLLRIHTPFSQTGALYSVLENHPGMEKRDDGYSDTGLYCTVCVPDTLVDEFSARLKDASGGTIRLNILSSEYV
jgi:uncharacterized YigZ family protein